MKRQIRISSICDALSIPYVGVDQTIQGLYLAGRPTQYTSVISYATSAQWVDKLSTVNAVKAVVISEADMPHSCCSDMVPCTWILSDDPEWTFYQIHDFLLDETDFYENFCFTPIIGEQCMIHPTAVIEMGVRIGDHCRIGPFSVLHSGTQIGDNVVIASGVEIGEDGFQIIKTSQGIRAIRHCGGVCIGNDVNIGAHSVIHRSLFEGETLIECGAKLDVHVYVAHNCIVGANAVLTAGVILCGSSHIEAGAWVGPNASVLNKVVVGMNSKIGMGSVVTRDVMTGSLVYGVPAKNSDLK